LYIEEEGRFGEGRRATIRRQGKDKTKKTKLETNSETTVKAETKRKPRQKQDK
jgi:hypothetical protein